MTNRIALLLSCASMLFAETGKMIVHVTDMQGRNLAGVELQVRGYGPTSQTPTDPGGKAIIPLPADVRPGMKVPLDIVRPAGLELFPPWEQRVQVPPWENLPENYAAVTVRRRGEAAPLTDDQTVQTVTKTVLAGVRKMLDDANISSNQGKEEILARIEKLVREQDTALANRREIIPEIAANAEVSSDLIQQLKNIVREEVASALHVRDAELDRAIRGLGQRTTDPASKQLVSAYENDFPYDFAISDEFFALLSRPRALTPSVPVNIQQIGAVHAVRNDCEMHLAAIPEGIRVGQPAPIVLEPPNVCQNKPPTSDARWRDFLSDFTEPGSCIATGFPRLFTERGTLRSTNARDDDIASTNPFHTFEILPLMSLACAGKKISFASFFGLVDGMPAASPRVATSCLTNRDLRVRRSAARGQYELREFRTMCANFVRVDFHRIVDGTVDQLDGGHSALAEVSTDTGNDIRVKIYTLAPSQADQWLARGASGADGQLILHGMTTYDFREIVKTIQLGIAPDEWVRVTEPMALIVFGQVSKTAQ